MAGLCRNSINVCRMILLELSDIDNSLLPLLDVVNVNLNLNCNPNSCSTSSS